ncbi:MAG: MarR family winged helix-turn-helix transcriptional regulator [Spirochaetales bacterium]
MTEADFRETEVFLLHKLVIHLDQFARNEVLRNEGITYSEFLVLMAVAEVEVPVHDNVCRYLDQSKSLVSQKITALRTKGLVRQQERSENRRQTLVYLTAEGAQVLSRTAGLLSAASEELFTLLGAGRETFHNDLRVLVEEMASRSNGKSV